MDHDRTPHAAALEASPFVGRAAELAALRQALDTLGAGSGRLVLLTGQPGIGKTRTAREFAQRAADAGARVAWGICQEQAGMPPYWPWTQIVRDLLSSVGSAQDASALDLFASGKGRVAAETHALHTLPPDDRFRLFDAVARLLEAASRKAKLLIVMDNLHLADTPSLRLLEHLVVELERTQILLVGTYRDVELSRGHPMSDFLGRIGSANGFARVRLRGLDLAETGAFIGEFTGTPASYDLVSALHTQTEGNPLFLAEIVRHLVEEGYFRSAQRPRSIRVPEGIREAIGQRLNRLSVRANRLLGVAAVLGKQFELAVLRHLAQDFEPAEFFQCLDEAHSAHIVEATENDQIWQFTHALIRETLYDELGPTRRIQLHASAANLIEQAGAQLSAEALASLAHHCFHGQLIAGSEKVAHYARLAGDQALGVMAYEDAARLYRLALEARELAGTADPVAEIELCMLEGRCHGHAGDNLEAMQAFLRAIQRAEAIGSAELYARAALAYSSARWRPGLPADASIDFLLGALERLPPGDSILRASILGSLARAVSYSERNERAPHYGEEAVSVARRCDDPLALAEAIENAIMALIRTPNSGRTRLAYSEELVSVAKQIAGTEQEAASYACACALYLHLGRVSDFDAVFPELQTVARRLRQPHYQYQVAMAETGRALLAGDFASVPGLAQKGLRVGARIRGADAHGVFGMQMFVLNRERGTLGDVASALTAVRGNDDLNSIWQPGLALLYAEIGELDRALSVLERLEGGGFSAVPKDDLWLTCMCFLADVCGLTRSRSAVRRLLEMISPYREDVVMCGPYLTFGPVARVLGVLAALEEDWKAAAEHFDMAMDMAAQMMSPPTAVRVRCDYADALLREGTPAALKRAKAMLDGLRGEATRLGMTGETLRADALDTDLRRQSAARGLDELTAREIEVLRLISNGASNAEISKALSISLATVATHVRNILSKTATANRTAAVAFARRHQIVS